ncbi:MAG: magnesium transporter [Alphaproteobacteria bacterium]|jgi:magnesium transporter|nr:magnesium transporter [Alphaproteobacteria bacterium]
MLNFYEAEDNLLKLVSYQSIKEGSAQPIWIDIFDPTEEEDDLIEELLGIDIPDPYEMSEIELSNRLYQSKDGIYVTGSFLTSEQKTQAITFILTHKYIISIRYVEFSFFARYLNYNKRNGFKALHHTGVFLDLLEAAIGQIADYIEEIGHSIDESTQIIFRPEIPGKKQKFKVDFKRIICQVGQNGDLISKTHESLMSCYRVLNFISESKRIKLNAEDSRKLTILENDILPLNDHATFLSNKVNFLLDACLGMINIDQNNIIKMVSVAAIIFFPPTLIASIYGMNFHVMPELKWTYGYPFSLILILLAGLLPYIFFKHKDWI